MLIPFNWMPDRSIPLKFASAMVRPRDARLRTWARDIRPGVGFGVEVGLNVGIGVAVGNRIGVAVAVAAGQGVGVGVGMGIAVGLGLGDAVALGTSRLAVGVAMMMSGGV